MKKLFKFKTTLEKIERLGFKLTRQIEVNNHMVEMYERYDKKYKFNQIVYISKKSSTDKWYIHSCEENCNSDGFNNCVALAEEEVKLFLKRIKEIKCGDKMKINEKKFKEILEDMVSDLSVAYSNTGNKYVNRVKSKLEVLLDLLEFEEEGE